MKSRVTISINGDGSFEIYINEAGRELLVQQLQSLGRDNDHFHLDNFSDPDHTDVVLSVTPYRSGDTCIKSGKVLFMPDDWVRDHYPHVLSTEDSS